MKSCPIAILGSDCETKRSMPRSCAIECGRRQLKEPALTVYLQIFTCVITPLDLFKRLRKVGDNILNGFATDGNPY